MSGFEANLLGADDPLPAHGGPRLVDVLDRLLDRGVVLRGELWLTVADVDLVFVGAHLTLASPDTMRTPSRGAAAHG